MSTHVTADLSTSALPGRGIKPLDSLLNHTRLVILTFVLVVLVGLPVVFIKGVRPTRRRPPFRWLPAT